jgi:hypothetical protein
MNDDLKALITRAKLLVDAMTPDELTAMTKAQQESWVRGEMGMGETVGKVSAALEPDTTAQCCACGKKGLSIAEDGGPECELADGRWTCSRECYDLAQGRAEEAFLGLPSERDLAVARHVLEAAAKNAETHGTYPELNVWGGGPEWLKHGKNIAAEIRALDAEAMVKGMEG